MAQFDIAWDNSEILANLNNLDQTVSYRPKTAGGIWQTAGFTPVNPMSNATNDALSPVLTNNLIYQFKQECNCTDNGPASNEAGIKECIGFICIVPTLTKTDTTAKASLNVAGTDIIKARFTLRKTSDNTIVGATTTVNVSAGVIEKEFTGLDDDTDFYFQIILVANINGIDINSSDVGYIGAVCGPYAVHTNTIIADLIWIKDTSICEKEGGFIVTKQITGLSSPSKAFYDEPTNKVYFGSHDNGGGNGNVGWFDPITATTIADVTFSTAINLSDLYTVAIDEQYRRIYFVGANTGGLKVYDVASDSISTVAYGTNGAFSRIFMYVGATKIYCGDSTTNIIVIDRATLAIDATVPIAGITTNTHFATGDYNIVEANSKIYVTNGHNAGISTIGVYNLDFSVHIAEIALPGVAVWVGESNTYWQSISFDIVDQLVYVSDIGSSRRYIIDPTTDTVIDNQQFINREGKSNVQVVWLVNPINNDLIMVYGASNNTSDGASINRIYIEDRTTHTYKRMIEGQRYTNLNRIAGTNNLIGCDPASVNWSGIAGWETDGKVNIISTSGGVDNTGTEVITILKEVDHNNADLPTGNTKPNDVIDPDYIAPIEDSLTCPLTYTTDCPTNVATTFSGTTLQYEFDIPNSVKNNPAIAKILIYAYNTNTASVEGAPIEIIAPFTTNYYSGNFTALGGLNYTIQIKYLDNVDATLQTC